MPYSMCPLFNLKLPQPPWANLRRDKGQEGKDKEVRAPVSQEVVRISKNFPIHFSRGCS